MKREREKTDWQDWLLLCVCICFYVIFPLAEGPVWCVDSREYVTMGITREPLYPTFLALCRKLAGLLQADPLMVAVVLQSILAGIATWYAGHVVRRVKNGSRVLQIATVLFQFAVTLLCRFAANRESAYTNSILTEGLGFSLFVLFTLCLFQYVWMEQTRYLWLTLGYSFLLVSLRKQMLITLPVMAVVFFWYALVRKRQVLRFIGLCVMVVTVFLAGKFYDRTYQYTVRGVWMEHSGNAMGILCTLLYSSDVERDSGLFADQTLRQLYGQIMEKAKEQQLLHPFAGEGWLPVSTHYADSYDAIGYGIINPVIEEYLAQNFSYSEPEWAMKYDEICGEMSRTLMKQGRHPLLQVYVYNTGKGLVNSIAQANRVLSLYALVAYAAVGIAAWALTRYVRRRAGGKADPLTGQCEAGAEWTGCDQEMVRQIEASLCFGFVVMTGIVVNALVVGLFIFAQPRYMIYGMGLFYTAASMLVYDILQCRQNMGKTRDAYR